MMAHNPKRESIVLIDHDEEVAGSLANDLRQAFGNLSIELYHAPDVAQRAIGAASELPAIVITDTVGVNLPRTDGSVADTVRSHSPLSVIFLYSASAYVEPSPIEEWLRQGLIDAAVPKGRINDLHRLIGNVLKNWDTPGALAIREYIANVDRPDLPYVSDGEREWSLAEEHREIVKGTPRGLKLAQAWSNAVEA